MKRLKISFGGGRQTTQTQLLIGESGCVVTSQNVWAPKGSLTKTPAVSVLVTLTATASEVGTLFSESAINTAYNFYARIASGSNYYPWAYTEANARLDPIGYVTGTIAVGGAGLISCTGTNTLWLANITAGDNLRVNATADAWRQVASVEDDTHLTLALGLPASTSNAAYTILPYQQGTTPSQWASQGTSASASWWSSTPFDWLQRYDGQNITRIQGGPKAGYLAAHKNYLFAFRTSSGDSNLEWSALRDPLTWPSTNLIQVAKNNGRGTGMISFGNELILFKSNSMHKLVGEIFDPTNPTYALYPIAVPPGFSFNANGSCAIHNGLLYFVAQDGIYAYAQGTFSIQRVSDAILPDVPKVYGKDTDPTSTSQFISGLSYDGNLIFRGMRETFAVSQVSSYRDYGLIMDRQGSWWKVGNNATGEQGVFQRSNCIVVAQSSGAANVYTAGSQNSNKPHLLSWDFPGVFGSSQASAAYYTPSLGAVTGINSEWRSKEFNVEYAHLQRLIVYFEKRSTGTLTVGWSIDQGTFVTASASMTVGRGNMVRKIFDVNQKGSTIQYKIINGATNVNFNVFALTQEYEEIPEDRKA